MEVQGNNLADQVAKEDASEKDKRILQLVDLGDKDNEEIPNFSEQEQKELQNNGGTKDEKGKWTMPHGSQMLNTRKILESFHASTHWGMQALCNHFIQTYVCIGLFEIDKMVMRDCMICQRIKRKVMRKTPLGGKELARRPFQNVQVDFAELPPVQRFKYLLVIIDHLTH